MALTKAGLTKIVIPVSDVGSQIADKQYEVNEKRHKITSLEDEIGYLDEDMITLTNGEADSAGDLNAVERSIQAKSSELYNERSQLTSILVATTSNSTATMDSRQSQIKDIEALIPKLTKEITALENDASTHRNDITAKRADKRKVTSDRLASRKKLLDLKLEEKF